MAAKADRLKTALAQLRKVALAYPDTREDFPWGESAFKVRGKTFVFAGLRDGTLGLSVKLTTLREFALEYPFTKPTGYGLGKSGWVSASFGAKDAVPLDLIEGWIDESYRTVAPKKLSAQLKAKAVKG